MILDGLKISDRIIVKGVQRVTAQQASLAAAIASHAENRGRRPNRSTKRRLATKSGCWRAVVGETASVRR